MAAFSPVEVSTEGFRLIGRRPVSFVVWTLVWFIFAFGPLLAAMAGFAPRFLDLIQEMKGAQDEHDPAVIQRMMDFELGLWAVMGPWILWVWVVSTVVYAAIIRAVLEPAKSAFAYLRIGADELRLFVVSLVISILLCLFIGALVAAGVAVGVASGAVAQPWRGWLIALTIIVLVCIGLAVPFRFSMAVPMTFAEKRIRIFESWGLTRGRFWSIVGMWLMTVLFAFIVAIIAGVLRQVLFVGLGLGTGGFDQLKQLETIGDDLHKGLSIFLAALGPALIAAAVVQGLAEALMRVVITAPFARAYAILSGRDAAHGV
jgi:hypothetical protein